jgi:mobilization protein NikA
VRRSRGGRPPLPAVRRRRKAVWLKLTPDELAAIRSRAQDANQPLAQFLRDLGVGAPLPRPVPTVNVLLWQELARVGGNLNQIAARLNRGEAVSLLEIAPVLAELRPLLKAVREGLLGRSG